MRMHIARVVFSHAGGFNLLETPLRQIPVGSLEIASKHRMTEAERSRKSTDSGVVFGRNIIDNFNSPVVLVVADSGISVTRNFPVGLRERSFDSMRVKIAPSLGMEETNFRAMANESRFGLGVIRLILAVGKEKPVVVGVLMVIASDLLLTRSIGVSLDVRVEQAASVSHVLQSGFGAVCDFQWAILSNFGSLEVSLEEGAHLGVSWARFFKDEEVDIEREHVDHDRNDNKANHTSC